jgi:hypothetical protein
MSNALGWRWRRHERFSLYFSLLNPMHQTNSISFAVQPLYTSNSDDLHGSISNMCLLCGIYMHGSMGVSVRYVYHPRMDELYICQVTDAYVCVNTSANCQQFFFQPPMHRRAQESNRIDSWHAWRLITQLLPVNEDQIGKGTHALKLNYFI